MNRVKQLRLANGYTQAELGNLLNCTGMTISRYESGKNDLDTNTINRLCEIFKCSSDYLLGRTNEPAAQLPRGEELDDALYELCRDLTPEEKIRAEAFIAGMKANRRK